MPFFPPPPVPSLRQGPASLPDMSINQVVWIAKDGSLRTRADAENHWPDPQSWPTISSDDQPEVIIPPHNCSLLLEKTGELLITLANGKSFRLPKPPKQYLIRCDMNQPEDGPQSWSFGDTFTVGSPAEIFIDRSVSPNLLLRPALVDDWAGVLKDDRATPDMWTRALGGLAIITHPGDAYRTAHYAEISHLIERRERAIVAKDDLTGQTEAWFIERAQYWNPSLALTLYKRLTRKLTDQVVGDVDGMSADKAGDVIVRRMNLGDSSAVRDYRLLASREVGSDYFLAEGFFAPTHIPRYRAQTAPILREFYRRWVSTLRTGDSWTRDHASANAVQFSPLHGSDPNFRKVVIAAIQTHPALYHRIVPADGSGAYNVYGDFREKLSKGDKVLSQHESLSDKVAVGLVSALKQRSPISFSPKDPPRKKRIAKERLIAWLAHA